MFDDRSMKQRLADRIELELGASFLADRVVDVVLDELLQPTTGMAVSGGIKLEQIMFDDDPDGTGVIFNEVSVVFRTMVQAAKDGG